MACGTPVVATDCPYGPKEVINEEGYGILVPMDDYESLANAVLSIIENKDKRLDLSNLGKKRARELSLSNMVSRYEKVLI